MAGISVDVDARIARAIVGALRERDLSGFEIWRWLGVVHGATGELDEASLYPTLYRLEAEGLLRSAWREDEHARRSYRLTSTGLREAQSRGWGAVAYRRAAGERVVPSDTGEGDWVWAERPHPAEGEAGGVHPTADHEPDHHRPEAAEAALVSAYLDRLEQALNLSAFHSHDVCHEISDHLSASTARLRSEGLEPLEAAERATAGPGPPEELARGINEAQLTTDRFHNGLRWASAGGMFAALASLAILYTAMELAVPILTGLLIALTPAFGLHLYAPEVADWHAQELGLAGCVSAFLGARRSMPQLAVRSRRAEPLVWRTWAILGAVPLAVAAILMPAGLDPLAAATMLAIPIAWIVGTRRPVPLDGDLISNRWAVAAILAALALMWLPGLRVWVFDPATTPAGGPPFDGEPLALRWSSPADRSIWQVGIDLPAGWHDPQIELRPADRSGLVVEPDPDAGGPIVVAANDPIARKRLSGAVDWWVTATATGPDGRRHTIATDIRPRARANYHGSILGWLLGRR